MRGLLSLWFKDVALLDFAVGLGFDLFEQKTRDYYQARKASRLFEEVADAVLKDLSDYIKNEHRNLKKGDVKVIVDSVLDVLLNEDFINICIEERLLAERVIPRLQVNFKKKCSEIVCREDDFNGIAKFIIFELLAIVDTLPTFDRAAFTKILEDTEVIIDRIVQLEAKFDRLDRTLNSDSDIETANYIKKFSSKFRKIKLFGVDSTGLPKNYDLSIAYINLTLTVDGDQSSDSSEDILGSNLIAESMYTIISGAAGSGKTTLLSWLALQASKKSLPEHLGEFNSYIPIFFRVREHTSKELPVGPDLLQSQMGALVGSLNETWVKEHLEAGKFLVLIDGFDEVTADRRNSVSEWIVELGKAFPDSKFYVTTRPYAASDLVEKLEETGLPSVDLTVEPMDLSQIEKFVDCWYTAYCEEAKDQEQFERLRAARERLKEALTSSGSLRSISNNPLLCALICFVNADREGFIPAARGELYSIAVDTLLDRRERERAVAPELDLSLTKTQKLKIMGFIASYFFDRKNVQLPLKEVSQFLEAFLPALDIEKNKSERIVKYLTERSQILRSPADDMVDFSHKTFQEFFYAQRVIDANYREKIADGFFDQELAEVVLFTCSEASSEFVEFILTKALAAVSKANDEDIRSRLIFLFACVNETTEIAPSLRDNISKGIGKILPPRSNEEAENLGAAGRGIIEPMAQFTNQKYEEQWPFCVAALISTFEEEAFPVLRAFAVLNSKPVDDALVGGKRFFESVRYNEIVLTHCKTIDSLQIADVYDMDLLNALKNLKTINILYYSDELIDINSQKLVTKLTIKSCSIFDDLSILEKFPALRILALDDCLGIEAFDKIGECKNLTALQIYSENLTSLSFINKLSQLEFLDVCESVNVCDVESINSLAHIRSVELPYIGLYDLIDSSLVPSYVLEADEPNMDEYEPTNLELRHLDGVRDAQDSNSDPMN